MLDDNLIKITQTIEIFKFRNFKLLKITRTRSNPPFTRKQIPSSRRRNTQERKEEGDETSRFLISYRSFCGQKCGSAVIRWFLRPKRTKWPVTSPRPIKMTSNASSMTRSPYFTVTISPFVGRRFSAGKRVSNAPLKVWKVTWHRRHTVAAFEKLVGRWNGVLKI